MVLVVMSGSMSCMMRHAVCMPRDASLILHPAPLILPRHQFITLFLYNVKDLRDPGFKPSPFFVPIQACTPLPLVSLALWMPTLPLGVGPLRC